jgi:hypothetical protein
MNLPTHYQGIDLDAPIAMPNHMHGIVFLADEPARRHAKNIARAVLAEAGRV